MHDRLSSILLILILASNFCLLLSPIREVFATNQGDLLGSETYLRNANSDVAGYLTVTKTRPTSTTNKTFPITATSSGAVLIAKWITPSVPNARYDLPKKYNFLFQMYGNKSSTNVNNASFFAELGYYRSGVEYPFFNSTRSDRLVNESMVAMMWQTAFSTNFTLVKNDRIYMKLYLYAEGSGRFYFGCESRYVPSFVLDPTETRFFRNDWVENTTIPTAYTLTTGNLDSGTVSNLATSDNSYMVFRGAYSTGNKIVNVTFSGIVGEGFHLPMLQCKRELKSNVTGILGNVSWYNYTAGGWDTTAGSMFATLNPTTSDVTSYNYILNYGNKYTSTTGRAWQVKFYLYASVNFTVSFDLVQFRSTYYTLLTTNTASAGAMDEDLYGAYSGAQIRIEKINQTYSGASLQSESSYRIDGGSDVAPVTTTGANEIVSNTHAFSALTITNMTTIVVYVDQNAAGTLTSSDPSTGGKKAVFMTEEFNDTQSISAVSWTIYYCMRYIAISDTEAWFFGSSTRNSNITNFQWTTVGAKIWNTVATWMFNLTARAWTSVGTWIENLTTRSWNNLPFELFLITRSWTSVATWEIDLFTKTWNLIVTWETDLLTRGWNIASTWIIDLVTRSWIEANIWKFDLLTPRWNLVSTWMFDLGGQNFAFLIIPILFLVCAAIVIFILTRK